MGVEHGGSPSQDGNIHRNTVDHVDGAKVRHTPVPETRTAQSPEGNGAVPVTVVSRAELEELQRRLQEAQAKAVKYDLQRQKNKEAQKRQRQRDPEHVRALTN